MIPIHEGNKFKTGDRVRVVWSPERKAETGDIQGFANSIVDTMIGYIAPGQVYEVVKCDQYGVRLEGISFCWPSCCFERVNKENESDLNLEQVLQWAKDEGAFVEIHSKEYNEFLFRFAKLAFEAGQQSIRDRLQELLDNLDR